VTPIKQAVIIFSLLRPAKSVTLKQMQPHTPRSIDFLRVTLVVLTAMLLVVIVVLPVTGLLFSPLVASGALLVLAAVLFRPSLVAAAAVSAPVSVRSPPLFS
jgi:uncharacterized membrane protein YccC